MYVDVMIVEALWISYFIMVLLIVKL